MRLFLILHSVKSHEKMTIKLNHLNNFFRFNQQNNHYTKIFLSQKVILTNHEIIAIYLGIKEKHLSHVNSN